MVWTQLTRPLALFGLLVSSLGVFGASSAALAQSSIFRSDLTAADFGNLGDAELLAKADLRRQAEWAVAAEKGDTYAMVLTALAKRYSYYRRQSGVNEYQLVQNLMMRAAAEGNARARVDVASGWLDTLAKAELDLVSGWLLEAANQKHPLAALLYGRWQINGSYNVPRDVGAGMTRIRFAANQGVIDAMLYLATRQPNAGEYRYYSFFVSGDGLEASERDSFSGSARPGVDIGSEEQVQWMRRAADLGNHEAQFGMAVLYAKGYGVAKDKQREVYWHRRAVENPTSERNLGVYEWALRLLKGDGVHVDRTSALAIAKEYHSAYGGDVPDFLREAVTPEEWENWLLNDKTRYFALAGRRDYLIAADRVRAQPKRAISLLKVSADYGDKEAMQKLAELFGTGKLIYPAISAPIDHHQSYYWYNKLASLGSSAAMVELAYLLYFGQGVPVNRAGAYAWLGRAQKIRNPVVQERAAALSASLRKREAVIAENERLNREWDAEIAREQARIDRQNAEAAAAYQARANQRHALNVAAWRFYRPQFTGFPTLDAMEADRAWKAAQADVRFFEYCRTNNCYARSTPAPSHSTANSSGRGGGGGGGGAAVSSAGASKPASALADGARGDRTAPAAASAGGGAKTAASSPGGDRSAAGSANAASTAASGADGGTVARSGPMLTIKTPFIPEPPPQLPEVPAFVPTPRPPRPVATEAPCPGPSACATAEARELTASERAFKAQMDAWYAANEAASAADAEQRKRIAAARAERTRISNEHGKRQSARRQACDAGDVSQCQP